jgi:hypothetical protein
MTDYQWGLLAGVAVGYVASLFTVVLMWALCVVAHDERGEQDDYDRSGCDESDGEKRTTRGR